MAKKLYWSRSIAWICVLLVALCITLTACGESSVVPAAPVATPAVSRYRLQGAMASMPSALRPSLSALAL